MKRNEWEFEYTANNLATAAEAQRDFRKSRVKWWTEKQADVMQKIKDSIVDTARDPVQYLIAVKYIDTLKEMVSGKDGKVVYMPYEASGVLGSLGGIKELFQSGK